MRSARRTNFTRRRAVNLVERADRYDLYQKSVQDVVWEMQFVEQVFRERRGRAPLRLREDFCGTALAACEWVRRDRRHEAIGVDLDAVVLAWGRQHNLTKLTPSAVKRLTLLEADVLTVDTPPVDLLLAFNFSYWVFKQRATLREYFHRVRRSLAADGVFMLDAYGGYDAFRQMRERQDFGRYIYIYGSRLSTSRSRVPPPAIYILFSPTVPGSSVLSVITGGSGHCQNCVNCCWKQVSPT